MNERWEKIWEIRAVVTKALEEARKEKRIGLSLDAQVHLYLPEKTYAFLKPYEKDLKSIFIVSSVTLHLDKNVARLKSKGRSRSGPMGRNANDAGIMM